MDVALDCGIFEHGRWSRIAQVLGVDHLCSMVTIKLFFSLIGHPKPEICERTGMKSDVIVLPGGVHDSNGSLVSFLATSTTSTSTKEGETKHHEFVLASTGT